jgi:hypothetical protein
VRPRCPPVRPGLLGAHALANRGGRAAPLRWPGAARRVLRRFAGLTRRAACCGGQRVASCRLGGPNTHTHTHTHTCTRTRAHAHAHARTHTQHAPAPTPKRLPRLRRRLHEPTAAHHTHITHTTHAHTHTHAHTPHSHPTPQGYLVSVDAYMNLQLANTEEYIDGTLTGSLGEVLIRCGRGGRGRAGAQAARAAGAGHGPRGARWGAFKARAGATRAGRRGPLLGAAALRPFCVRRLCAPQPCGPKGSARRAGPPLHPSTPPPSAATTSCTSAGCRRRRRAENRRWPPGSRGAAPSGALERWRPPAACGLGRSCESLCALVCGVEEASLHRRSL